MTCGIYLISNKRNGKCYIGSSTNIDKRWKEHIHALSKGNHSNEHLQNAWNKYGASAFVFSVIIECRQEELLDNEQHWMDNSNSAYNKSRIAGKVEFTKDVRSKISAAHMGRKPSAETVAKMRAALMGNHKARGNSFSLTEEQKAHLAGNKYALGYKFTDEQRKRVSEAQKRRWAKRKAQLLDS